MSLENGTQRLALDPPTSTDERTRLATLRALGLPVKDLNNKTLQDLCETLVGLMKVQVAVIAIVGETEVHYVVRQGTEHPGVPRSQSICTWVTNSATPQVLIIEDASKDARFAHLPGVANGMRLRYFVAAPLLASNGQCIGSLFVVDFKLHHTQHAEDYNTICNFAELAARELETNCYTRLEGLCQGGARLLREPEDLEEPIILCEVTSRWWSIVFANRQARALSPVLQTSEAHFWMLFQPANGPKNLAQKLAAVEIEQGNDFTLQVKLRERGSHNKQAMTMNFRSALTSRLSTAGTVVGIPNTVGANDQCAAKVYHSHYFGVITRGEPSQKSPARLLGAPQTFFSREFRTSSGRDRSGKADASKGLGDVKLGVICSSSPNARIYRAVWNKKVVSVKVIAEKMADCVQSKDYGSAMIPKEAALSAELIHPNVIKTYKIVLQPKIADVETMKFRKGDEIVEAYIVREWCGSGDLQAITQRGQLSNKDRTPKMSMILELASEIAAGMEYLHIHNIIHGALHPTSILMGEDTHGKDSTLKYFAAKVASFNRAAISAQPVAVSIISSDVPYAAPEVLQKGLMSKASDVYAFGKLLYYMYSSELVALPPRRTSRAGGKTDLPPFPSGMPTALEALIRDCLATKPAHRPDFTTIKDRLATLIAAQSSGMLDAEAEDYVSEMDAHSFKRRSNFPSNSRRSIDQAKAAVGQLFRNPSRKSITLGRLLTRKDTPPKLSPKANQDFTELIASGGVLEQPLKTPSDTQTSLSSLFGKRLKELTNFPSKATAEQACT